ncbi:MAG: hypothetical protein ACK4RK_13080 [Gemmataceae bacterium]
MSLIQRGILLFWALWLSLVAATNIMDGLQQLGVVADSWRFTSGNYAFMVDVTARYHTPGWLVAGLFLGVVVWEALAALLFWLAAVCFSPTNHAWLHLAFGVSLALWAAFMLADEIFMAYQVENVHRSIFLTQIACLLLIRLAPAENGR